MSFWSWRKSRGRLRQVASRPADDSVPDSPDRAAGEGASGRLPSLSCAQPQGAIPKLTARKIRTTSWKPQTLFIECLRCIELDLRKPYSKKPGQVPIDSTSFVILRSFVELTTKSGEEHLSIAHRPAFTGARCRAPCLAVNWSYAGLRNLSCGSGGSSS